MKISIKKEKRKFTFWVPLSLFGMVWGFALSKKYNNFQDKTILDKQTIKILIKSLCKSKKYFSRLTIVEVHSKDGKNITITL